MAKTKFIQRVGIYSGTFDPVHAGHLSFALKALDAGKLDHIYFLPERVPRHKTGSEHFGHRVAMLNRALKPYSKLSVLELPDRQFTIKRTVPALRRLLPSVQLSLLVGSDLVGSLGAWPGIQNFLQEAELVVGLRSDHDSKVVFNQLQAANLTPLDLTVVQTISQHVSSSSIREALRQNRSAVGLLTSVRRYARESWLYTSLPRE